MSNKEISLNNLSDKQKTLLAQFSYLDIDLDQFEQLKKSGKDITVSDLESLLKNPDNPYVGSLGSLGDSGVKQLIGDISTEKDLLEELKNEGLGDLKITDISSDSKSGFNGIAFEDSNNNTGISYRGTDLDGLLQDSYTNAYEYVIDSSTQSEQANKFFEKNKNSRGDNYLYGHSLGGNLTEHVYLNNYNEINNAFVINPYPINQDLLDTDDKISAFNDPNKFDCNVIGGDPVSELRDTSKYSGNIDYIVNNEELNDNIISDHLTESATFDENSNFVTKESKEEVYSDHEHSSFKDFIVKPVLALGNFVKKIYNNVKDFFKSGLSIDKSKVPALPDLGSDFKDRLNVLNWANSHDNYSLSQAQHAIEFSNNPFKYFTPQEKTLDNDRTVDDELLHTHSHEMYL